MFKSCVVGFLKGLLSLIFVLFSNKVSAETYNDFVQEKGWNIKQELGFWLFADKRLSGDNSISCMSCHAPEKGWSDGLPKAIGFKGKVLNRRTPTIIGVGFADDLRRSFFWDGRSDSLHSQALEPVINPDEMNQNLDELILELSAIEIYVKRFSEVYGNKIITPNKIADAIASFERTVKAPNESEFSSEETLSNALNRLNKDFDKNDPAEKLKDLYESKNLGEQLFMQNCVACHRTSENLSDGLFHDIGLLGNDFGRANVIDAESGTTQHRLQKFKFKTPTLWGVAQRGGPYMHDGSKKTLREVIEHYNNGGSFATKKDRWKRLNTLSSMIRPLELTEEEMIAIENFITTEFALPTEAAFPLPPFLSQQ